ncbi:MAG: pyruvate dehydrogenase (acetyl-transferring), homodimeric type [Gammaproteobacteria bacterium]|nr:pyruvate dehydrogenase (acetyl-transferring), homodimeric type [Gammaproteobacteria bacterium]
MTDSPMMVDNDPLETQDWLEALASVMRVEGAERARFLVSLLASQVNITAGQGAINTPYVNTIKVSDEVKLPDDGQLAESLQALIRWNAKAIVLRGGKRASELGGHIATYASASTLYEVGFNHFFRARQSDFLGDLLFIQGHSSPGIYARAYLEGRISAEQLDQFRQEVAGKGLSSYPHPWLMPKFWQFPTVSMGLGPLQAIYQARFLKYLGNRGLVDNKNRHVWVFCGDGEMDEPESMGALSIAAREKLNNLIFVINCNLQRLDGPVRGNSKVVQEFEGIFRGAGWHVIKVLWGSQWDKVFAKDTQGILEQRMVNCVDGEMQNYVVNDGAYFREHFFNTPELKALVADLSDEELLQLNRGGHDLQKVYAAYHAAMSYQEGPVVILAQTVKGYGMGTAGEGLNITHQQKKMSTEDLIAFKQRFKIPVTEEDVAKLSYIKPNDDAPEMRYLHQRRKELGGFLPARSKECPKLEVPGLEKFSALLEDSGDRHISTTMAFVRILSVLLKEANIKQNIVPIVPDESRTFGMEGLFRQIGIYSPSGQLYEPVDKDQVMSYREKKDGQYMQEGICEAGGFATWMAAATSYSTNGVPMIPFYIYYSMFGFQRVMDLAWAAGDMRARGFLMGATAGRTTLAGEGLQHTDGHSHVLSALIPNCVSYDPTYSYELAVIIRDGMRRMVTEQEDVFYYITVMNENYAHPAMPAGVEENIIKGLYLLRAASGNKSHQVNVLSCGAILREAEEAAKLLSEENIDANVWSVTSFTELAREALHHERENRLHPEKEPTLSFVTKTLAEHPGPVIAATDYVRSFVDQIRAFVPFDYTVLGTDGYGRSDTRVNLRHFFEVDAKAIAAAAMSALCREGKIDAATVQRAMTKWGVDPTKQNPATM